MIGLMNFKNIPLKFTILILPILIVFVFISRNRGFAIYSVPECNADYTNEYRNKQPRLNSTGIKRILYWTTYFGEENNVNRIITCGLQKQYQCKLVSDKSLAETSHALIFHAWRDDLKSKGILIDKVKKFEAINLPPVRHPDQYYVLHMQEPPEMYLDYMHAYDNFFNWTMTYRTDSDAYHPYGVFNPLEKIGPPKKSTALDSKPKLVTWLISNCKNVSNRRLELVEELQKHVQVDVFGRCGKSKTSKQGDKSDLAQQYKFYLALENSNCQDYMTEKVFDSYQMGMVPIVYGGASYDLFLPPGSYINMNSFPSAQALANYLMYLDTNPEEYAKFFEWQRYTTLRSKKSRMLDIAHCHLCEKLHRDYPLGVRKMILNTTKWLYEPEKKYQVCNSQPLRW